MRLISTGLRNVLRHALWSLLPRREAADAAHADEQRVTVITRVLLAATALGATRINPAEPSRFVEATYTVLTLYVAHSIGLWFLQRRAPQRFRQLSPWLLWVDVGVYAALIAMSGGSNSIYFALFFFAILTASVEGGFGYGVLVTAVSVMLFVIAGYLTRPVDPLFELDRFLLRTGTLAVLGYLMAYRGGYELRLRRRLALLRELSTHSNPRFGPHRMLARSLQGLRLFFDADLVVAILPTADGTGFELRRAGPGAEGVLRGEAVPSALANVLLSFDHSELICHRPGRRPVISIVSASQTRPANADQRLCEQVSEVLGGGAFLSVPMRSRGEPLGRLYVMARLPRFDPRDSEFLLQAADQIMPALSHIELVERMATRAAEDERERIALDIHDRLVQPYIGLHIGIAAVREGAAALPETPRVAHVRNHIDKLHDLASLGISDLRRYVRALREGDLLDVRLADSLRRFAQRFEEATGIAVTVAIEDNANVDSRLAAEVVSMVSEAVSNVRRHTNAPGARVVISTTGDRLVLRVENQRDPDTPPANFVPRSLAQRAAAANGSVGIESGANGTTVVVVTIPL